MVIRQDQEAAVVGDEMETIILIAGLPADSAIPCRTLPRGGGEAQQGEPLRTMRRHIPQGVADLRQRPQVVMGLHQRLKPRLVGGAVNGLYGDLVKVQMATLVGPGSLLLYPLNSSLSIRHCNVLFTKAGGCEHGFALESAENRLAWAVFALPERSCSHQ